MKSSSVRLNISTPAMRTTYDPIGREATSIMYGRVPAHRNVVVAKLHHYMIGLEDGLAKTHKVALLRR